MQVNFLVERPVFTFAGQEFSDFIFPPKKSLENI